MHQIEVKRYLIQQLFHPSHGWTVTVDLDAMELGKGIQNSQEKSDTAAIHEKWMQDNGIAISSCSELGRVDIVAKHPSDGIFLVECEGDTTKQPEQAMYSALGQLLLHMKDASTHYVLAVPKSPIWSAQVAKITQHVRRTLGLRVFLVSSDDIKEE